MKSTPPRRARKRARKRQRELDLLVARAALALHYNGEVPEHLRGLNLACTRRVLEEVAVVREFDRQRAALARPAAGAVLSPLWFTTGPST